jgi:hypothetical protein
VLFRAVTDGPRGDICPRLSGRAQLDRFLLRRERSGALIRQTAEGGSPVAADCQLLHERGARAYISGTLLTKAPYHRLKPRQACICTVGGRLCTELRH